MQFEQKRPTGVHRMSGGSPWHHLQQRAEKLVDESGLRPWWVLEKAEISRHVFERPFGRDMSRFAQLREQRMIYRLALGQPNQEDFIEVLARGGEATRSLLSPLVLDLSAMGLRQAPELPPPDRRGVSLFPLPLEQIG
ncbi:hypothetical protein [Mesorhizobium sp.]|uniref:hypothetical protein n=1 Tax=Mesorhizobium sp. TaxID=1871066 RepID=UPI00257C2B11|nr:hypothetical protein [Mesorhizobium sp.]